MSHQLEIEDGKASIMYVGRAPWHGLGTRLPKLATAEEAIAAARLDWTVAKAPRHAGAPQGPATMSRPYALVRQDPRSRHHGAVLGHVEEQYTPLQNREAFAFFDPVVGAGASIFETAGALGRGERVWILAKAPGQIKVTPRDVVDKFLLLSNSHVSANDGSSGVEIRFTPVRVVCGNTLSMALALSRGLKINHTPDLHTRLRDAAENTAAIEAGFEEIEKSLQKMVGVRMSGRMLTTFLDGVFSPFSRSAAQRTETTPDRLRRLRDKATWLFQNGQGNDAPEVRGTLWAAYNGVTEMVDYYVRRDSPDTHLQSIWFGEGARLKTLAYKLAAQLAQASVNQAQPRWVQSRWAHPHPSRQPALANTPTAPDQGREKAILAAVV